MITPSCSRGTPPPVVAPKKRGPASGRDPSGLSLRELLFVLEAGVGLSGQHSIEQLVFRRGDNPKDTSLKFCRLWNLEENAVPYVEELI